jgi:E3 ubiquitin-protein ligase makorin
MALKTIPCPYYASGSCRFGEHCELMHHGDDRPAAGRGGGEANDDDNNDDDDDGGPLVCGICLEPPRSFGILSCCNHAFCYSCLMEWRKEGSSDVASRRVCPTCRMSSDYVVPSPYMPSNSDEKERILREYRDRCSTIPCKKFELGRLGSCPFGRDCFYAHADRNGKDIKMRDRSMQQLYETRQRERNDRDSRDIEYITDMLMMMGMQRHLARQERGGGGGGNRGRGSRRGNDLDDDSDDDDDDGDIFFSDVLAALLRDEPGLLDRFTSS